MSLRGGSSRSGAQLRESGYSKAVGWIERDRWLKAGDGQLLPTR